MTLRRRPGSEEAVLMNVIRQLTPEEIEDATGKTIDHFRHLSANKNGQRVHLRDAGRLDAALEAKGLAPLLIPHALEVTDDTVARLGGRMKPAVSIEAGLRHLAIESGALNKIADEGMADGRLDRDERHRIGAATYKAENVLKAIRKAVEEDERPALKEAG